MQQKDKMHPEDTRNLIIFAVLAIILYFGYDALFLKPQAEAMKQQRVIAEQQAQIAALNAAPDIAENAKIKPRSEAVAASRRLKINNDQIFGSLSLTGARLDDISFHEYYETLEKKENVELLSPRGTAFPRFIEYGWVAADKKIRVPDADTSWQVQGNQELTPDTPVLLTWNNSAGLRFEREIALDRDYMFTITQRVINTTRSPVTLYPYGLISQTGISKHYQSIYIMHEGPLGYIGDELVKQKYKDMPKEPQLTKYATRGWIGIGDKYWFTGLIPQQGTQTKYSFTYKPDAVAPDHGRYQTDFLGDAVTIAPGEAGESTSRLFTGAKKVVLLNKYAKNLNIPQFDLTVDFGIFWFMTKPFFYILHWLGQHIGNMGIAILVLTFLIRSAVFPLTNASYRSFAKMKKVSPQIVEMREKYGDDKQKLQQELIALYQREGVNPMAGCLPIILQIPIFFALYKIIFITIEIRHAPFFGWIQDLSAPDPTSIFNLFGLLPYNVPGFLMIGVWPCLMLLVMIVQKKLNPPPQDQLQRDMANYFPFVITFVLSKFASGLVLYWTFSAFLSAAQQMIIMRSLGVPIHLFGETEDEKKLDKAVEKGPAVHPLVEMAEDNVEDALFGEDSDKPTGPIKPLKPKKKKKKK